MHLSLENSENKIAPEGPKGGADAGGKKPRRVAKRLSEEDGSQPCPRESAKEVLTVSLKERGGR